MSYEDWDEEEELKDYLHDDDGFDDAGNIGCFDIVLIFLIPVGVITYFLFT